MVYRPPDGIGSNQMVFFPFNGNCGIRGKRGAGCNAPGAGMLLAEEAVEAGVRKIIKSGRETVGRSLPGVSRIVIAVSDVIRITGY